MGMSVDDFDRCTPSEFQSIAESYGRKIENEERGAWERTRMSCLCALQPYSKNSLKAQDIMRFPWEEKDNSGNSGLSGQSGLSEEEKKELSKKRYEAEKKKWGIV